MKAGIEDQAAARPDDRSDARGTSDKRSRPAAVGRRQRAELRVWDAEACARVHDASCRVLDEAGVEVRHEAALRLLAQAGARVTPTRPRLPRELVDRAIAAAPGRWLLKGRAPDRSLDLELVDGETWFGTGPDCMYVTEPGGERRRARLNDVTAYAALAERLPNIDFVMSMALPEDVDPEHIDLRQLEAMLSATRKPIVVSSPFGGAPMRVMSEMAAVAGERDSLACLTMSSPPLQLDEVCADKLLACGELSVPVVLAPSPDAGVTAPASLASVVVVANAEVLAGLVVHQLAHPGAPFLYGVGVGVINLRTMISVYRPPGVALGNQAMTDLARHYGLASWHYAGESDSKLVDGQHAAEAAVSAMLGQLGRATLLHDVGYLESGLQSAYEALVLGDELAGYARAVAAEVPVDDDALAVDEILQVGPGGNHLTTKMTRRRYRDFWQSRLMDQSGHERWREAGALSLSDRLRERTRELLAAEPEFRLDEDTRRRLGDLVAQAPPGR